MIYLASPYRAPGRPSVEAKRHRVVLKMTRRFLALGFDVFCPIVYGRQLNCGDILYGRWLEFDRAMLARCDEVWVLCLDGWRESTGVAAELAEALKLGKPFRYLDPASLSPLEVERDNVERIRRKN